MACHGVQHLYLGVHVRLVFHRHIYHILHLQVVWQHGL
nr:MAG TPA: hypothetical protein [Bacteriophage sp.]